MSYRDTPTLSVDAVHVSAAVLPETDDMRLVGAVGGWLSGAVNVS